MITIECPWCDEAVEIEELPSLTEIRCPECAVHVEIAQDETRLRAAA